MYDMSLIGTVMKWDDIVKEFPDRWVVLMDCTYDKCYQLDTGKLMAVGFDNEFSKMALRIRKLVGESVELFLLRTTDVKGQWW